VDCVGDGVGGWSKQSRGFIKKKKNEREQEKGEGCRQALCALYRHRFQFNIEFKELNQKIFFF
jgi:hypothetical protein